MTEDLQKRSYIMSRIRSRDTRPELMVRRYLFAKGYRYRKNVKGMPGTPDIVMQKYRCCIFVHGCFWHGHEHIRYPETRAEYWRHKIEGNRRRDEQSKERLREMGWNVITIWECQLAPATRQQTLEGLEYRLNEALLARLLQKRPRQVPYPAGNEQAAMAAEEKMKYGAKK